MHPEHHRLRLNNLTAIAAMAVFLLMVTAVPNYAFALGERVSFGGKAFFAVPMIPNPYDPPNPLCPAHLMVANYAKSQPPLIGLYFNNNGFFRYLFSTFLTGSNKFTLIPIPAGPIVFNTLGKYDSLPYLPCNTFFPYPVYPVSVDSFGSYFIGTSVPLP